MFHVGRPGQTNGRLQFEAGIVVPFEPGPGSKRKYTLNEGELILNESAKQIVRLRMLE
jgi:hypothetical protein